MADNHDNPGIRVPPPLIYLLPLILGLLLEQKVARPLFVAQCSARPRVAARRRRGVAHGLVLPNDAQCRRSGTHRQAGAEADH